MQKYILCVFAHTVFYGILWKMAHLRKRQIFPLLEKCLRFSPLVGVVGHRQVGKTTLISGICKSYYSLDDENSIAYMTDSASLFLKEIAGPKPVAIDEAQLLPKLFPALKEWVRKRGEPGQFLLSGSVRFTSLRAIRESLTGRIVTLELFPLSLNEQLEVDPPETLFKLHASLKFSEATAAERLSKSEIRIRTRHLIHSSQLGGLPGICFVRNDRLRAARIKTQLETLLDRDLRLVTSTRLGLGDLKEILRKLANSQGERITASSISGARRMNSTSVQSVLEGLEALFLIRRIPIVGDLKGSTLFFEDLAEHHYLSETTPSSGNLHILFSIVRSAFAYRADVDPRLFQFRTRGGAVVPLVVQTRQGMTGFVLVEGEKIGRVETAAASSFLSRFANAKIIFCTRESVAAQVLDERRLFTSFTDLTS